MKKSDMEVKLREQHAKSLNRIVFIHSNIHTMTSADVKVKATEVDHYL